MKIENLITKHKNKETKPNNVQKCQKLVRERVDFEIGDLEEGILSKLKQHDTQACGGKSNYLQIVPLDMWERKVTRLHRPPLN